MPDGRITDQNLANRRGLLLGMTLAEVMLIVLFCLLLLLGQSSSDLLEEKRRSAALTNLKGVSWAQNLTNDEANLFGELMAKIENQTLPNETRSDAWKRLTDDLEKMRVQSDQAENSRMWRETSEELGAKNAALMNEIQRLKAGSPPPCLHERPADLVSLRGESIALGAVHIENGRMTLIDRNNQIPDLNPVDYLGRSVDYKEAYDLLMSWPEDKTLSLVDFGNRAKEFVRIGDDESGGKLKCRFTMNYYIEDGTPIDMLVKQFMQYFYLQNRLRKDEFELFRRN